MIAGSCLCGGVRIEVAQPEGPFELCHCSRCRKASGTAFAAGIWVRIEALRWRSGRDLVRSYAAPVRESPPPYRTFFCGTCGSPLPDPDPGFPWVEVPAGMLDGDPGLRPDKHLVIGPPAPWYEIRDALPRMDRDQITADRIARWLPRRRDGAH